jgi:hypothetical protein
MKPLKKFGACASDQIKNILKLFHFYLQTDFFLDSMLLTHVSILGSVCLKD